MKYYQQTKCMHYEQIAFTRYIKKKVEKREEFGLIQQQTLLL